MKFRSILTKQHFADKQINMLEITVLNTIGETPFGLWDVRYELEKQGISGYSDENIIETINLFVDLHEIVKVKSGYTGYTDDIMMTEQLGEVFVSCRRPPGKILASCAEPHLHNYVQINFETDKHHRIPVPTGSRVFARIYHLRVTEFSSQFFSHIYAYQHGDNPITSIDLWFWGKSI